MLHALEGERTDSVQLHLSYVTVSKAFTVDQTYLEVFEKEARVGLNRILKQKEKDYHYRKANFPKNQVFSFCLRLCNDTATSTRPNRSTIYYYLVDCQAHRIESLTTINFKDHTIAKFPVGKKYGEDTMMLFRMY